MSLQQYSKRFWFPNGVPAANIEARVFLEDSSAFAPLFTDGTGAVALPNPTVTDGSGILTFWAEIGSYWLHLDTESFLIDVGMTQEQADLSTGIASGGQMDANAGNPKAVDIGELVGYVTDVNNLTSVAPSIIKVDRPAQTVVLDAGGQSRALTNWLMDSAGNVIQQEPPPSAVQRRTHLQLGVSLYDVSLGAIVEVQTLQTVLGQPLNQVGDLMDSMGPFNLSGNVLTPVAATLSFNKSSGTLFARGLNHFASGVPTDSPHINPSPARSPALFKRVIRVAESPLPPDVTTIDPTQYDLNGVLTPVGGGTNTSTVQRVYVTPSTSPSAQMAVQYGQTTYNSLSAAVAAIGTAAFTPNPISGFGALVAYIAVIRTATNLADPTQATIVIPNSKLPTH